MRRRWVRTVLALFPCVVLIAVLFVGSTIPNGLVREVDKKILQKTEQRQEIVSLDPGIFTQSITAPMGDTPDSGTNFDQRKYDIAIKAPQVKDVYPQYGSLLISPDTIGNLAKTQISLTGNNAEFAKLYTDQNFVYKRGQPIPLILNPRQINSEVVKMGGKKSIDVDFMDTKSVTNAIEYSSLKDADKLIGRTISANINQFGRLPDIVQESWTDGSSKSTFSKLSSQDRAILTKRTQDLYSSYWNIKQLQKPLNYEFKIVGISRDQDSYSATSYIPNEAVVELRNEQYQLQKAARTKKVLDNNFLSAEEAKSVLKENKLPAEYPSAGTSSYLTREKGVTTQDMPVSSEIPGLIVEQFKNTRGQSEFKETSLDNIKPANFGPSGAVVRLKSAEDRESYLKYLKEHEMELNDQSPLAVIKTVRKWENKIVTLLTLVLGSIAALILLTTMGRFVADSRREIGVWRAIGATKLDIKKLVIVRMALLLAISIGIGIGIGIIVSYFLANYISSTINASTSGFSAYAEQNFIGGMIISFLGGEVPQFSKLGLMATDWLLLLSRLGLLSIISLLFCLIPARRASRISPIIAIRDSE